MATKDDVHVGHRILGNFVKNEALGRWGGMNPDEKSEWMRDELQRMSALFAMLSSQVQEIGRRVKAIQKKLKQNQ